MSTKRLQQLRALLKTYAERMAKTGAGGGPALDPGERKRRACGERLQKVVRPVLQEFVAELETAGHDASLQDRTDSADAYPSVALSFTPRGGAGGAATLSSLLTFRYDPRRGLAVQREIKAPVARGRVVTGSTDRIGTIGVDAVTADWVETKTLSFIEAVLKAN